MASVSRHSYVLAGFLKYRMNGRSPSQAKAVPSDVKVSHWGRGKNRHSMRSVPAGSGLTQQAESFPWRNGCHSCPRTRHCQPSCQFRAMRTQVLPAGIVKVVRFMVCSSGTIVFEVFRAARMSSGSSGTRPFPDMIGAGISGFRRITKPLVTSATGQEVVPAWGGFSAG